LQVFALCDVASSTRNGLNFAVCADDRNKNIIVNSQTIGAYKGNLIANWLARMDNRLNLAFVLGGMPGGISQFEAVFTQGFFSGAAPHFKQRIICVGKT